MDTSHRSVRTGTMLVQATAIVFLLTAFYLVPDGASPLVLWPALVLFYIYFLLAIRRPIRIHSAIPTFVTIEVLFLIFYYILFLFPYQLHLLGLADLSRSAFVSRTFVEESNRAVIAAALGLIAFCLGIRPVRTARGGGQSVSPENPQAYRYLGVVSLLVLVGLIALYQLAGWRSSGEGRYTGTTTGGSLAEGVSLLIQVFCMIAIALATSRVVQRRRISLSIWLALALTGYWAVRILMLGDRNAFLLIAIAAVGGLLTFCVKAGRGALALCVLIALLLYNAVEVARMSENVSLDTIVAALTGNGDQARGDESSFNITTVTLRASLEAVPDHHGFSYGLYKLIGVAGIVPLIRGFVIGQGEQFTSTADILALHVLGEHATWGVGTNIISDIYIDFSIFGVPALMFLTGRFAAAITRHAMNNPGSVMPVTLYLMTLALFAELPRYSIDFPVRFLTWTVILFALYRVFFGTRGFSPRARPARSGAL